MAVETGVVLAALMGAAAALMGGVLAQRYQYLLEKQREHFAVLRDQVLARWPRAIAGRQANLEGRDPYVVLDFVAKDYRSSPGVSFGTGDQAPWTEDSRLAEASRRHWPGLWAEWATLNRELVALGERVVALLRRLEKEVPPLPAGKAWANYGSDPGLAVKMAVVNLWASHAQAFERRTYPDWVVSQLTQFGFWRGEGDEDLRRSYAQAMAALLERHGAEVAELDRAAEDLSGRFKAFAGRVEHAMQREDLRGRCDYCPRFLR